MRIWLPPSEGKTAPDHGPSLDLDALPFAPLTPLRHTLLAEVHTLAAHLDAHPEERTAGMLGPGTPSDADVRTDLALRSSPCAPVEQLLTGVLYDAAHLADLDSPDTAPELALTARARVRVFTALFGLLTPGSLVPDHRLAMSARGLPGPGLASRWRPLLDDVLREDTGDVPVLDMRSGPYRSAAPAPWANLWTVGVVRESGGTRSVVSHDAKRWRGHLTATLLRMPDVDSDTDLVRAVDEVRASALVDAKGRAHRVTAVEVGEPEPTRAGGVHRSLTLVTD